MRADSFAGQVIAVMSRRTSAFQPSPEEPSTFPGRVYRLFHGYGEVSARTDVNAKHRGKDSVAAGDPPRLPLAVHPDVLHLPRFDRAALRTAGTASARRQSQETVDGEMRYLLRDAGRDRLEIVAESDSDLISTAALTVTVTTPERSADYLLLFRAQEPGRWTAAVHVPGFRYWADVSVRGLRELSSLDRADTAAVARSVRTAPDPWVPAWEAVAQARDAGDPVREAIEESLRP